MSISPSTNLVITLNVYQILQCNPDCSNSDLRTAYLSARSRCHPDKTHAETEDEFKKVVDAYSLVCTPSKRVNYDAHRESSLFDSMRVTVVDEVTDMFDELIKELRTKANIPPEDTYADIAKKAKESVKEATSSAATSGFAFLMKHYFNTNKKKAKPFKSRSSKKKLNAMEDEIMKTVRVPITK